ncbi:MAG: ADP-ribosylglycohydrolase family protein [Proteobacteria bacterium]|nr:ADP-ribosylglycohydrolase family protein [Pseudomonadota bacterium]MBU4037275.1 ADP-ribosylglycohydrolase family protein [Pseudomonadota bacterium]
MNDRRTIDYFKGCLIGGAIGDALGAPVEFMSLNRIRSAYGKQGLTDYAPGYGRKGAITDDTQMLLFTAEGLMQLIIQETAIPPVLLQAIFQVH